MSNSSEPRGFTAPTVEELAPLFPGYQIESLIACGGMGAVFCAIQKSLDRTVAIKILPRELSSDAAFCASFEAEAKAMGRLNHPNLIGVYDFGEVQGMLYIVMEFVPGQSLYHSAYGIAVDQLETVRLVSGICSGLAHAHEHGILHRDIKPSNILLDLNGQPKIGDFGLAGPIDRKVEDNEEIFGTPHYTAPEVVNAPHSVDVRADIFSVGVLLHELLTGKLPAADQRPASLIARCDPRFDAIIRRATQPLPAARYSNVKEMLEDLKAIGTSLAPKKALTRTTATASVRRPTPPARQAVNQTSNRRGGPLPQIPTSSGSPTLVLFAALVLGGLATAAYFYFSEAPKPPVPTVIDANPPPVNPPPKTGSTLDPSLDPHHIGTPSDRPSKGSLPTVPKVIAPPRTPSAGTETDSSIPTAAKFDVPTFLANALKTMRERTRPNVVAYEAGLRSNVMDFEYAIARQAKKTKSGADSNAAAAALQNVTAELGARAERLPETLTTELTDIPDGAATYAASLKKQVGVGDAFYLSIASAANTYVQGLQLQIDRLKPTNDPIAIELIEQEILRTKSSTTYFGDLILGNNNDEDE
jgi:serine/threonine protein kinase